MGNEESSIVTSLATSSSSSSIDTMAEKEESHSPTQNLVCPLCLDTFEDATLLNCGHTFCRKCLQYYDASHQDLDHMVCPLCRKTTKLLENRVQGLPANITVKGLVDDYLKSRDGESAFLEPHQQKCTACDSKIKAVTFCVNCSNYMCESCHHGHQQLKVVFKGHNVVSVDDVASGKVSIGYQPERCPIHKHEHKDMICKDCKVHACFKCVITDHREHNIKNQAVFEEELQEKVNSLIHRCTAKKTDLNKNIQNVENHRKEVLCDVQRLIKDVKDAYNIKARLLKENECNLIDQIQSLRMKLDQELDALINCDTREIESIDSTSTLVAHDKLGQLETDSLAAHNLLCEELDNQLKEDIDKTSAADVHETARLKCFEPSSDVEMDLGKLVSPPPEVVKKVTLSGNTYGIAKRSKDSVFVALHHNQRVEVIDCEGNKETLEGLPNLYYYGIAIQGSGTKVISHSSYTDINIYAMDGSQKVMQVPQGNYYPHLSVSPSNEIVVSNRTDKIFIYDSSGETLTHTVTTKCQSSQAFMTKSGAIVSTSGNQTNPGELAVYDRDGRMGSFLKGKQNEYLYAAADDRDRIYVATVNAHTKKVLITLYELYHLNMIEPYCFNEIKLSIAHPCSLTCLSRNMLALASGCKLHFIKVCA